MRPAILAPPRPLARRRFFRALPAEAEARGRSGGDVAWEAQAVAAPVDAVRAAASSMREG